jgi:hypothetical protein
LISPPIERNFFLSGAENVILSDSSLMLPNFAFAVGLYIGLYSEIRDKFEEKKFVWLNFNA